MSISIRHRYTDATIYYNHSLGSLRDALVDAHQRKLCLDEASLPGADLSDLDLPGLQMRDANLAGAKMWGTRLQDANLKGCDFTKAEMQHTMLRRADLSNANLTEANLDQAFLHRSICEETNFTNALLHWVNLNRANCNSAIFQGTSFEYAHMEEVQLRNAVMAPKQDSLRCARLPCGSLDGEISKKVADTLIHYPGWLDPENHDIPREGDINPKASLAAWIMHFSGPASLLLANMTSPSVAASFLAPELAHALFWKTPEQMEELLKLCRKIYQTGTYG